MTGLFAGLVYGFVIGVILCLLIAAVPSTSNDAEDEHEHDWEVRGAHQMFRVRTYSGIPLTTAEKGTPITEVLFRCSGCEEVTTETLEGHWTYAQLSKDYLRSSVFNTIEAGTDDGLEITEITDQAAKAAENQDGRSQGGAVGDAVAGGVNPDGVEGHSDN